MLEKLFYLNKMLLNELPEYKEEAKSFSKTLPEQRRLFRSLVNLRPPMPARVEFLKVQDLFLQRELEERGVVSLEDLAPLASNKNIYLWQGDITRLKIDSIVNAANSALLGCFVPCHGCIDNAIHSYAGIQLREACHILMEQQGKSEKTGGAKITPAFNLPSSYVIHTVGPIVHGELQERDCELLKSCYASCLELAIGMGLKSIAFCSISTGEFHFPNEPAARIAIKTVNELLSKSKSEIKVVFNVFKEIDYEIYRGLLGENV